MRIGIGIEAKGIEHARKFTRRATDDGFASAWFNNIFGTDAVTACAVAGADVPIESWGYVTPAQPLHPQTLAQDAMAAHDECEGRFNLGVGLSHKIVVEDIPE